MPNVVTAVIPARFQSSRLPGKVLKNLLGKSLLQRTYDQVTKSKLIEKILIATDDERIFEHAKAFGADVVMTSKEHMTGTDRIAEAVQKGALDADIVVNIQADEPCISPETIDALITQMIENEEAVVTTPIAKITDHQQIFDPSAVKCVYDASGRALYFSRAPIPFPSNPKKVHAFYRHIGVYCYRKEFLLKYVEMNKTRLQQIEDLEQLKILESGYPIHVSIVEEDGIGIDTPEDLKKVEKMLCKENISSLPGELSPR